MKKTILRLGSLALDIIAEEKENYKNLEINRYYPNSYYGRENDYNTGDGTHYFSKKKSYKGILIHKSMFKEEELCYTIVTFIPNSKDIDKYGSIKYVYDNLESKLSLSQKRNLKKLIDRGYQYLKRKKGIL